MISCSRADMYRLPPAGVVLVIALGLAGCQQQTSRPENPPTVVQVETVTLTDYAPTVRLTGEIRATGRERSILSGRRPRHRSAWSMSATT